MNENTIRQILFSGGCLEFGRLSISPLDRYYRYGNINQWQVHCDDSRSLHSEVYHDINKAIQIFIQIGKEIDAFSYKEPDYSVRKMSATQHNAMRRNSRAWIRQPKR
jgi:hypothetical protein